MTELEEMFPDFHGLLLPLLKSPLERTLSNSALSKHNLPLIFTGLKASFFLDRSMGL